MSDKIRIYGLLESGLVGGYVTNKDQIDGLADSLSSLNDSISNLDQSDIESFTYDDAKGLIITTKGKTEFTCDLTELKNLLAMDGMLEDVSIITSDGTITHDGTTYPVGTILIKFLWNTAAGSKLDYLRADQIGKVYTAGTGINIDNTTNTISVSGLGKLAYKDSLSYSDVGALSATGTAVEAESLTEAPSINVGQDDSNTITITAGTKTSQPFTVPYSRETKKLSGGRVVLKFYYQSSDTPIYLTAIDVSYLRQLVFNVDTRGKILSCDIPQDDFLQISLEKPSGIPELSDELFRVINVKSNGFTIPGTSNNGPDKRWVSNNKIKAGTISNIEVLITAE